MRNTKFVSAIVQGNKLNDDNCIVLCFYGPKGGTRAIETLSLAAANLLAADLTKAVQAIDSALAAQQAGAANA
jgi:dihydroxyacid dehydratase/phosphogluconate dehydratase